MGQSGFGGAEPGRGGGERDEGEMNSIQLYVYMHMYCRSTLRRCTTGSGSSWNSYKF